MDPSVNSTWHTEHASVIYKQRKAGSHHLHNPNLRIHVFLLILNTFISTSLILLPET